MTDWKKIPKAPYYLEVREGKYKTSYRVFYRGEGHDLRETLEGNFRHWKDALKEADRVIAEARFPKPEDQTDAQKDKAKGLILSETLCDEIVSLKQAKDPNTYRQAETFFRLHIKPFLREHCTFAADLNSTVWLKYKTNLRLKDPTVALFNHWKFFGQLCKHAHEKGIIPQRLKLDYSEQREDFRERGLIIPEADFEKIIAGANRNWRDRVIIQKETGMRPGEVRELRKDRYNVAERTLNLRKEDTKTRQARSFLVTEKVAAILEERLKGPGPFFFPSERDPSKPMDKHLNGWKAALKKAEVSLKYTPHDIRHSYLTRMFKTAQNPALICYQAGLSLEEAQKTYLHFTAQDTKLISHEFEKGSST